MHFLKFAESNESFYHHSCLFLPTLLFTVWVLGRVFQTVALICPSVDLRHPPFTPLSFISSSFSQQILSSVLLFAFHFTLLTTVCPLFFFNELLFHDPLPSLSHAFSTCIASTSNNIILQITPLLWPIIKWAHQIVEPDDHSISSFIIVIFTSSTPFMDILWHDSYILCVSWRPAHSCFLLLGFWNFNIPRLVINCSIKILSAL